MLKAYKLLENVLDEIEKGIKGDINADTLAQSFDLSSVHLQRLFKFAFRQSLGSYIRSRKLGASVNCLLNTNANVLDIAVNYGFDYEQSYIRAFKREFGITPGYLRKNCRIVKITPPLHLFDANELDDDVIFGMLV